MFNRPALLDLVNRTRDDLFSRLPDNDAIRRSDAEVYARVIAGATNELYGYLDWLAKQVVYDTADSDLLRRWASIWGILPKPAVQASGTLSLTGTNGAIAPAGSLFQASDGIQYSIDADVTIIAGVATANITAVAAGISGNRVTGQTLTAVSTISGINSSAVAGLLSGGGDAETDDALRLRFIARIRQQPHGGASFDYVAWALEVPNFTRAWVYPLELGAGTVIVRGMCDNTYANGIPLSADITALQTHLDGLRPVTANVTAVAPTPATLNFTITGLSPNTASTQAAVLAALKALILAEGSPGGTLLFSHLYGAIRDAAGVNDFVLTAPSGNVVSAAGAIPVMGTITYA